MIRSPPPVPASPFGIEFSVWLKHMISTTHITRLLLSRLGYGLPQTSFFVPVIPVPLEVAVEAYRKFRTSNSSSSDRGRVTQGLFG